MDTSRTMVRLLLLGSFGLPLACRNAVDVDAIQDNIDRHRALWSQAALVTYRFDFLRRCFCAGIEPVTIEVANGVITFVTNRDTGAPLPEAEFAVYVTVDELFDAIQTALDQSVYSIEAAFDPLLGYPTRIVIDPDRYIANDEVTMTSSAVEPI